MIDTGMTPQEWAAQQRAEEASLAQLLAGTSVSPDYAKRPVIVNGKRFECRTDASRKFGMTDNAITKACRKPNGKGVFWPKGVKQVPKNLVKFTARYVEERP